MKSTVIAGLMLITFTGAVTSVAAHEAHYPGVNARQHRQHARIQQGVRSGELTRREAHGLRQKQRAVRAEERAYKADGKLTRAERKDLHQDLNQVSRDIHRQKHDGQARARNNN